MSSLAPLIESKIEKINKIIIFKISSLKINLSITENDNEKVKKKKTNDDKSVNN